MRPIILILGPTAGGKTELAIDLAQAIEGGGECLCADSMQVYRGMDIGTAKPTPRQQSLVPHHLLDLVEPDDESFSVDTWLALAEEAIAAVRRRGATPIVVGGTNLYIQALLEGLFDGPPPDPARRESLAALSPAALRRRLEEVDANAAARIHVNDRKRAIRAIEVFEATGRPLSALQTQWSRGGSRRDVCIVGLQWPAEVVNRRINARVRAMIDAGLVDEVRRLWEAGRLGRQAREALGYKQIIEHLEGGPGLEDAIEQIKIRTRRFAKQQRTWLRRFTTHGWGRWLPANELTSQQLVDQALEISSASPCD